LSSFDVNSSTLIFTPTGAGSNAFVDFQWTTLTIAAIPESGRFWLLGLASIVAGATAMRRAFVTR
jgi:hypothetical protein